MTVIDAGELYQLEGRSLAVFRRIAREGED
jgi:hypothetical protein